MTNQSAVMGNLTPADQVWRRSMDTQDVEAHAICQPGWQLTYQQVSAGAFRGAIDHVHLPGMSLLREGANRGVLQRGQMAVSGYGFAVPLTIAGAAFFGGQPLDMHSVMVGASNDLRLCSQGPFWITGVIIDAELLHQAHQRLFDHLSPLWLEKQIVLSSNESACASLRNHLQSTFHALATTPSLLCDSVAYRQLRDALLLECLNLLPEDIDCNEYKTIELRCKVVDRTCEFVRAHGHQPLSLLQLCSHAGASERKLNYCFQNVLGMSPGRYLRAARLNGVRHDLRNPDNPHLGVQDIAAHWGFWHLSQFATDYKRQFGELPSQTLQQARKPEARH